MGQQYLAAVKRTDRLLGRILNTVDGRPGFRRHTLVCPDRRSWRARRIALYGQQAAELPNPLHGVGSRCPPAGRNLTASIPGSAALGSSRTSYRGKQPIRNGDLANLATDALDLPRVPGSQFDSPRTLDLFR